MTGVLFKDGRFYEDLCCGGHILLRWASFEVLNACLTQKVDNSFPARVSSGKRLGGMLRAFSYPGCCLSPHPALAASEELSLSPKTPWCDPLLPFEKS